MRYDKTKQEDSKKILRASRGKIRKRMGHAHAQLRLTFGKGVEQGGGGGAEAEGEEVEGREV